MFGSIGMPELILIFVVALLVFGPKKLPEIGKSIGKGLAEFKRASDDLKKTIEQEIEQGKTEASAVKEQVAGVFPREAPSFAEATAGEPSFAEASEGKPAPSASAPPQAAAATPGETPSFAKASEDSLPATPDSRPIEPS